MSSVGLMSCSVQVFGRREGGLSPRCCGRRPKSAKARNRVMWGVAVPRAMGILPRAQACGWRNGADEAHLALWDEHDGERKRAAWVLHEEILRVWC
jgi:hypothetical protein